MKNSNKFAVALTPLALALLSHVAMAADTPAKAQTQTQTQATPSSTSARAVVSAPAVPAAAAPAAAVPAAAPSADQPCTTATSSGAVPCTPAMRAAVARARRVAPVVAPAALHYAATEALTMSLGEIKLLPVSGKVSRVALGSGSVLSATTVDKHLLLIAEKLGDTTLMVWSGRSVHSYRINVVSKPLRDTRAMVDALVANQKGITVSQVGSDLVLSGVAHREVLAKIGPMLAQMPNVLNNIVEDQGSAFTRSVLFRLSFVEVKKSLLEQIGIDWAKDAPGPVFGANWVGKDTGIYKGIREPERGDNLLAPEPAFFTRQGRTGGVFFGLATTIGSRLNLGINDGDARVLASPELTAKSGGKAKLQVGGEVPIPLTGAFGATTVEFKPYGIMFSVEPHIDANNIITAKLSTELSQIDPAVQVAGIPGFITRNTATEISVKPGEIVALSGLVNSELSSSIDRVPGLSRIPIFGRLFRSDDFRNRKTELIVFVEAEIISAGDGLAAQLRDRGLAAEREFNDKVKDSQRLPFPAPPLPVTAPGE